MTVRATLVLLLASTAAPALAQTAPQTTGEPVASGSEQVIVTASPLARSGDRYATSVTVVKRDETLKSGAASLGDALKNIPGVTGNGFAPGASRPVLRGQEPSRVLIAEDGVGTFDVSDIGPDHGVPVDPLSAQRIEIVRGPATLRYGSQAIGGVVNVINNRVPTTLPNGIEGEAVTTYSGVDRGGEGAASIDAAVGDDFAIHADGFVRNDGDYDTPDGRQPNSFARMHGESIGGSYVSNSGFAGLDYTRYDATYGLPSDTTFIRMKQDKYLTRGGFDISDAGALERITWDAGYGDYEHTENDPDPSVGVISTFLNKEFDGRVEAIFGRIGPAKAVAAGIQYQHRDFSALGEDSSYLFPATAESEAAYVFAQFDLTDALELDGAVRVEGATRDGTPADSDHVKRTYTPVSLSAGLLYTVSPALNFGLTLSSVERAPGLTELFARGGHDGPETYETGDPDLVAERTNSIEATARYKRKSIDLTGSLWSSDTDHFVYGRLTGDLCDDDDVCAPPGQGDGELKQLFYEQRHARFWGYEAKAKFDVWTMLAGTLSLTLLSDYVHATFTGSEPVPRIPPLRFGIGAGYESDRVQLDVTYMRTTSRNDTAPFETPTDGYDDLSASASVNLFDVGTGSFTLTVVGHNLTDAVQRNAVSFSKDDVINPGRDIRLVSRLTF